MKIKPALSTIAALLLLACLVPVAHADDSGSVEGSFRVANSPPVINEVSLTLADGSALTPGDILIPFQTVTDPPGYRLTLSASDSNGLDDITGVTVYLHYDEDQDNDPADAVSDNQDTNTQAMMTWHPGTGFDIEPTAPWPGGGEWSLNPASVAAAGQWTFYFQISKVAMETDGTSSDWDLYVIVEDSANSTSDNDSAINYRMAAYREINVEPGSVNFGTEITPGAIDQPGNGEITVNIIANSTHQLRIYTSTTWGESQPVTLQTTERPAAAGHLILWADAAEAIEGLSPDNDPTTVQVKDASAPSILADNLTICEASDGRTLYTRLWLDLGSDIPEGNYSGSIVYRIE